MSAAKSEDKKNQAVIQRPPWVWLLAFVPAILAIAVFFVPVEGQRYWTFDYLLFLAAMLLIPSLLLFKKTIYFRSIFIVFALGYFGFLQTACPRPVGAIELIFLHLFDDKPILSHLIKVGVLLVTALLFARYYCGWICPKGVIQEFVYRPRLKIKVPEKLDRILKWGKYIVLIGLIAAPLIWQYRLLRKIGPFKVLFNLDGAIALIIFFAFVLLVSVFIERAFCRYFCPVGGLLGLVSLISPLGMTVQKTSCNGCGLCEKVCQTGAITVEKRVAMKINAAECVLCKDCEKSCPKSSIYYGLKLGKSETSIASKELT